MSGTYRVVKLMKNRLYPTYQLHAFMANDKTSPRDGLRLAALTTMDWLKARLGDEVPEEWNALPAPDEYRSATDDDLPSLYINQGHVVNIVSLPDKGMWTLQITEPDLGSDPGNPGQARQAVPGRIIETNIAFLIVGKQLECGFKTVISDPVGTEPEAEVYRTAVVRQLMQDPAFRLKQVTELPMEAGRLENNAQIKTMLWVTHHADNQLPTVIFTQPVEEPAAPPTVQGLSVLRSNSDFPLPKPGLPTLNFPGPTPPAGAEKTVLEPPYDLEKFAYYTFSHCRTYVLEHGASGSFSAQSGISFRPGDTVVIWPTSLGGGHKLFPLKVSETRREETLREIETEVKAYLKGRALDYGHIMFLSGAREYLLKLPDEMLENAELADAHFRQELEQVNSVWKNELAQKDREMEALAAQLLRQKEYAARLEDEKSRLREEFASERDKLHSELAGHREIIEFLRRRYDQPRDYDGVAAWVEEHFSGRLLLHPRAIARMRTKAYQCASVALVCDALDYLATDYWEQRYRQLPREIALTRCGEKYGRPFVVKPTGQTTIDFTPSEYRIKYFRDARGEEIDSDMDYHLRVGNDPENLLRIYFLHDDDEQRIVVGSLPDHLRAVKIQ